MFGFFIGYFVWSFGLGVLIAQRWQVAMVVPVLGAMTILVMVFSPERSWAVLAGLTLSHVVALQFGVLAGGYFRAVSTLSAVENDAMISGINTPS